MNEAGDLHGMLKFVQREEDEILRYLTGIQSCSNHTISDVKFWTVEGGTVISMPLGGDWVTSLENCDEQLWSVALQLLEAVEFMHEHNVAHMDLKPQNILIPPEGGRLSIIDFSVSIHVRSPSDMYIGVVGTEDYIAPEIREGPYKPLLADLWSCGKTLKELCLRCRPSAARKKLLAVSSQLMNYDPEARPTMSTVLGWMASTRQERDNAFPDITSYVEVFSTVLRCTYICFCRTFPTAPMSAHELFPFQTSMQQIPAALL